MAWVYVGSTTGAGTGSSYSVSLSGTLTGGVASSPATNDLVVVMAAHGNTASSAPNVTGNNSGAYTGIGTAIHANDTWDTEARPFYKVMGGTPDTSLTITRTNTTTYGGATVVHVWRGVDTSNPFIGVQQTSGTNGCVINCPAYNPAVTDAMIFAGGAGTMAATSSAYTGITGMSNFVTRKGDGSTSDCGTVLANYAYAGVSYDPAAVSGGTTSTSSSWAGFTFAFRMAPPPNYDFTLSSGSYSITGQSVTIKRDRALTASNGSYSVTGQSADLIYTPPAVNYELTANHGTYTLTGQSADLVKGRVLEASSGTYSITEQSQTLLRSRLVTAGVGSYGVTGRSITIQRNRDLSAQSGAYSITGQSATIDYALQAGYELTAQSGTYSITGQSVTIVSGAPANYTLTCQSGTYLIGDGYVDGEYWESGYIGQATITIGQPVVVEGGGSGSRKRRTFIEREGKILLFNSNAEAAEYVQAEKSLEKPKEAPKKATSKPKKVKKVSEPQVINVEALKAYFQALQQQEELRKIEEAIRKEEFEILLNMQIQLAAWMAEEDDIETLLLVI